MAGFVVLDITDAAVAAMLERIAKIRGVSPDEMIEILIRVYAASIDTMQMRKQGPTNYE